GRGGGRQAWRGAAQAPEPVEPRPEPLDQLTGRELLRLLDEEVGQLPEVNRLAVILCCLEGKTQEEAARQLGWTAGQIKGRLERGRKRGHGGLGKGGGVRPAGRGAGGVW